MCIIMITVVVVVAEGRWGVHAAELGGGGGCRGGFVGGGCVAGRGGDGQTGCRGFVVGGHGGWGGGGMGGFVW